LAMKDAVAPRAPLSMARLLMAISLLLDYPTIGFLFLLKRRHLYGISS
jgi:hypothetical protein